MPTKTIGAVSTTGSQRDNRYEDTFTDQHRSERFHDGRPWNGPREYAANRGDPDGFCSLLSPGTHLDISTKWQAPWFPEQRFFKYNYKRAKITIDYAAMLAHDVFYSDQYYSAAAVISYEKGWEPTTEGSLPQFTIRKVLGEPPRSPKIAQAAMAGDQWLLGFSLEPNTLLSTLIGLTKTGLGEAYTPPLTPAQVLEASSTDVKAMIAQAVAQALADRDVEAAAKKEKDRERMAKARGARGQGKHTQAGAR